MATEKEVESFIYKFNQLWRGGFAADLQFKCIAGQAHINLQVGLGYAPTQTNDSKPARKHVTPSRIRRRIRRENIRNNDNVIDTQSDKSIDVSCSELNVDMPGTLDASESTDGKVGLMDEMSSHLANNNTDTEEVSAAAEDNLNIEDDRDVAFENSCLVTEEVDTHEQSKVGNDVDTSEHEVTGITDVGAEQVLTKASEKEVAIDQNLENDLPEIVVVYAKACFASCPVNSLSHDDLESLSRFINSKDHLQKNIANIQFESVRFDGVDDRGLFEHSVQVKLAVLRRNLWQGARAYVSKHLGSEIWERSNGSTIVLNRINQK